MEEQPLMMDEMMSKKSNKSNKSKVEPGTCCCCNCACEDEYTKDETCCGCFPVKCGIHFVGILTYVITIIAVVFAFFQFLNEFFPWWYPAVTLLLFIPLILALVFFISFWIKESDGTRGRLIVACILVIVSFALVFLWHLIFIVYFYKGGKEVHIGTGDPDAPDSDYQTEDKRKYIFVEAAEATIIIAIYSYYICFTSRYAALYEEGPKPEFRDDEEEKKMEEEKKDDMEDKKEM